ncbi:MAG: 50S ribosomal protein L25 [Phycisphaerae bacterium]|nr:50S ribosomal protein L25 [Phycisphaerae bacterium]
METIKATARTEIGTNKVQRLRKEGKIPGIIYGHGSDPVAVTLAEHDLDVAIQHGERLLSLDMGGKAQNVLIKDVQYDTFGMEILHVDLTRVNLDETVEVTIEVKLVGTPEGQKDGGVLRQVANEVRLEVPVQHIPEEIKVLVTELKLDDRLNLSDLELPEGAKLLDDPASMLCVVSALAEEVEAEETEGEESTQPEVIGERNVGNEEQAE